MDASCPSLPPKLLAADKVRPNKHTPGMPLDGLRLAACSWYVQLVVIEVFPYMRNLKRCANHLV
jgi:hypothetical protein